MPTAKGWLVAATGVAMLVVAGVLGARALGQVGIALLALVAIAVAVVRLGRHDLRVARRLSPERVRPSQPVTVTVEVVNEGSATAPLLLVEDRVPAGLSGSARFALRGVERRGRREASLTLTAGRRGRYHVGPMEIAVVDPFGLARLRSGALERSSFLVHPPVEALALPRDAGDRHSLSLSSLKQPTGSRGEDFYTLREYVEGDDLRKIHWSSTAKRGRYMIRQEETPWQTKATIVLDDRDAAHDGAGGHSSFERAVEASASLVALYHRCGYGYRLAAAHHAGVPGAKLAEQFNRCLDVLATIKTTRAGADDDALAARLAEIEGSSSAEAALVVVAGTLTARDALAVTRCRNRFREITVITFPGHRFSAQTTKSRWEGEQRLHETVRLLLHSGVRTLALGPEEPLASAWAGTAQRGASRWAPKPELV